MGKFQVVTKKVALVTDNAPLMRASDLKPGDIICFYVIKDGVLTKECYRYHGTIEINGKSIEVISRVDIS